MMTLLTTVTTLIFSWPAWARDIVAFHGLNQSIRGDVIVNPTDCTAGLVNYENHQFIENTIPSVEAAFKLGATIGHINLRKTADNKLAVFHDEALSCRTDGSGNLSQSSMAYLKQLDVGYGYTPDNGTSYPTRGFGKGLMPTFEEVL
jgi:glycerophosphoryl diester phosphodiesterase